MEKLEIGPISFLPSANVEAVSEKLFLTELDSRDLKEYNLEKMREYDGRTNPRILVALLGKVYDVTSGAKFYGPGVVMFKIHVGGPYEIFAGRDATLGLATFNLSAALPRRLRSRESLDGSAGHLELSEKQIENAKRWEILFAAKYILVGHLSSAPTEKDDQMNLTSDEKSIIVGLGDGEGEQERGRGEWGGGERDDREGAVKSGVGEAEKVGEEAGKECERGDSRKGGGEGRGERGRGGGREAAAPGVIATEKRREEAGSKYADGRQSESKSSATKVLSATFSNRSNLTSYSYPTNASATVKINVNVIRQTGRIKSTKRSSQLCSCFSSCCGSSCSGKSHIEADSSGCCSSLSRHNRVKSSH